MDALRRAFPKVMRHRFYRLSWTGVFLSNIGTWMETLGVGIYVTRETGQAKWTATVAALLFLPAIVLGPIGGALADRFDRRKYLGIVTGVQMTLATLLTVLAFTHRLSVPLVAGVMALTGCAQSLINPAFTALLVDFVPADEVVGAVNLNSAQFNLARIVGPALAAPLIVFGLGWAFLLNAVSFLAVMAALFRVEVPHEAKVTHQPLWSGMKAGLRAARTDHGIRSALCISFLASFFISPFIALVPVFAMKVLHRSEAATSWLIVAQGLGAIALALCVVPLSERYGRHRVVALACALLGPACISYWVSPTYGFALVMLMWLGAMHLGTVTGCNSVCQSRARRGMRARVGSLFSMVVAAGYATGCPVLGILGDRFGLRLVASLGALLFLTVLCVWRALRPKLFTAMDEPLRTAE